jgi:UDP-N-acetylmuramoylalanine--D-glutamate ligase
VITARAFADKSYAVFGLARSGLATVERCCASGASVSPGTTRPRPRQCSPARPHRRPAAAPRLYGLEGVVVSPGLPINRHAIAARAREAGCR